jgi:hypothetical protein
VPPSVKTKTREGGEVEEVVEEFQNDVEFSRRGNDNLLNSSRSSRDERESFFEEGREN